MGLFSDPAASSVNNSSNHDNSLSSLETTPSEPEPRRAVGRTKSSRRRRRRLGGNLNLTMLLGESRQRNKSANDLTRMMASTEADTQSVQPTRQRPSRRKSSAAIDTMGGSSGTHTTAAGGGAGVSSRRRGSLFGGVMNESMTASSFWNGNRGGMDESSHRNNHSNNHSSLSLDEYLDEMESFARLIKEADPQQRDRIFRMVSRKE